MHLHDIRHLLLHTAYAAYQGCIQGLLDLEQSIIITEGVENITVDLA